VRFDSVVVGAGLIGSAAARHLVAQVGSVAIVGPDEGSGPPAAWHDEARLTRIVSTSDTWAGLAAASMARYGEIEAAGGHSFHRRGAVAYVCEDASQVMQLDAVGQRHGAVSETVASDHRTASAFCVPDTAGVIVETGDAGVVNPRRLVTGQLAAAVAGGATVIRQVVTGVRSTSSGVDIVLDDGSHVTAGRVLLAAGGSINVVLGRQSPARSTGITAARFRLDESAQEASLDLPGFLWYPADDSYEFVYGVPPTRYPDGHQYVKLGVVGQRHVLDSAVALADWCRCGGSSADIDWLRSWAEAHVPAVAGTEIVAMGCAITTTDTDGPVIEEVDPGVWIVTGCDGAAAKSCDEIGRLAAVALSD
jgi:sarcosine oxidase